MPIPHSPQQNHLLAALPTAEFEALATHLKLVPMRLGEMLYEPGRQLSHAYFPYDIDRFAALRHAVGRVGRIGRRGQ